MKDETEDIRRARVSELSEEATNRAELETRYGQVWNSQELRGEFEVIGFAAPLVIVRERKSRKLGSLEFQHSPRFYFSFQEDRE